MEKKLDLMQMYKLMEKYFEKKITRPYINSDKQEITAILYDAFVFKFGVDGRYQSFKGGIFLDEKHCTNNFFGESLSMNNDEASILANFEIVEKYCRLRLPDKFLEVYDKSL